MVDFWKRPQMENPLAPARSLRRAGKVSYITLLHLSSLTRRNGAWKLENTVVCGAHYRPRGTPRQPIRTQFSASIAPAQRHVNGTGQLAFATSAGPATQAKKCERAGHVSTGVK